jgi:hypothetical protein
MQLPKSVYYLTAFLAIIFSAVAFCLHQIVAKPNKDDAANNLETYGNNMKHLNSLNVEK